MKIAIAAAGLFAAFTCRHMQSEDSFQTDQFHYSKWGTQTWKMFLEPWGSTWGNAEQNQYTDDDYSSGTDTDDDQSSGTDTDDSQ